MIKGLHHNAYRCKDSEETRKFYEDFLGPAARQRIRDRRDQIGPARPMFYTASTLWTMAPLSPFLRRRTCLSISSRSMILIFTSRWR